MKPKLSADARVRRMEKLANQLDGRFTIFGVPVGWDAILGFVPVLGALVTIIPTALMITEGARFGARKRVLVGMAWNGGVDLLIGGIPIVGDVFDLFFKSHRRNVALLRKEAERLRDTDKVIPFERIAARFKRSASSQDFRQPRPNALKRSIK